MRRKLPGTDFVHRRHNSDWSTPAATTRSDWPVTLHLTPPSTLPLSDWPDQVSPQSTSRLLTSHRFSITIKYHKYYADNNDDEDNNLQ